MTKTWQMSLMRSVMLSLLCEREREWKWVCTYKREREREREETCVLCSLFSTGRTDSVRKWEREYCVCVCGVLPSKNQSWRGSFLSVSDLERERLYDYLQHSVWGCECTTRGGDVWLQALVPSTKSLSALPSWSITQFFVQREFLWKLILYKQTPLCLSYWDRLVVSSNSFADLS